MSRRFKFLSSLFRITVCCVCLVVCRSYYIHLAECVYMETKQHCLFAAASYLVTYFLDGWRPYLSHHYNCEIGKTA